MTLTKSNLQIDSARLWNAIHETAKFGGTPKGGVRRLTLGAEDKQVRDWFRDACEAAGCTVSVDALGTMFAVRPGHDMSKHSQRAENLMAFSAPLRRSKSSVP